MVYSRPLKLIGLFMKQNFETGHLLSSKAYVSPEVKIIEIDTAQVICQSSYDSDTETYMIVNEPDWF